MINDKMNYAYKLQSSAGIYSSVNTSKSINGGDIVRAHCFGKYLNYINNGRDFSSYTQALEALLKRKLNKNKRKMLTSTNYEKAKQFPEFVKLKSSKSTENKVKIYQMRPSQVKYFAEIPGMTFQALSHKNKYTYDSTRSFDPNLFIRHSDGVKHKEEKKSSIEPNIKYEKKSCNSDILESFPLRSIKVLPVSKISKVEAKEILREDYVCNNNTEQKNLDQTANVIFLEQDQVQKDFEDINYCLKEDNIKELGNLIGSNSLLEEKKFIEVCQSLIDVAVNSNKLNEALQVLSQIRKRKIWKTNYIKTHAANLCGLILNSYGLLGDWKTVSEIKNWMESDEIYFNYQCYAALLDCLGRLSNKSNIDCHEQIIEILQKLTKMRHSVNGLFTEAILTSDQRENILNTVRKILPNFQSTSKKINLNSNCKLVLDLYLKKNNLTSQVDEHCLGTSLKDLVKMQLELEKNFSVTIKPVPSKMTVFKESDEKKIRYLENLKAEWRTELMQGFLQASELGAHSHLKFYLNCLPPDTFVDLMMEEIDGLSKSSAYYTQSIAVSSKILGEKVERRYEIKKKVEKNVMSNSMKLFYKYCDWYANPSGPALNSRQQWQVLLQENVSHHPQEIHHYKWPLKTKMDLGKFLYEIIFKKVKVNIGTNLSPRWVPVFYRIIRFHSVNEEQIKFHPRISQLFKQLAFYNLTFETSHFPMLCPPKPWISVQEGGYLSHSSPFYRKNVDPYFKLIDLEKIPSHELYAAFDSLNAIQNTPWKINEPILDNILKIFEEGGCEKLDVPKFPEKLPAKPYMRSHLNALEALIAQKEHRRSVQERKDQYSLWCEALYRLSLANHLRKKTFWLPYNFDFRGRLYPLPPLINHLGSDTYRALLMFGKGKPLGPKGLDWIKIHTISLAGTHKQKSLQKRLEYANSILPDILDSAENPLNGGGWWKKSDEPWQTLAACMEIKKALDSPSPEDYICHLPIHQDGSCNGLQHYAALGRDKEGGINVNLTNCSKPQDVYTVVTSKLEKRRVADAKNGTPIAQLLEGYISRKVIKQTVMTTVYGVTKYGAKLQISKQLNAIEGFPREYLWEASNYLVDQTFDCLREMFSSAKEIQNWFTACATVITEKKKHVKWISPVGLPILQPYSLPKKITHVENGRANSFWPPNKRKQKTAFPPNFIHSLDSSHLMLTALYCEQAGLTFASIHDCFWTHPISVETMNKICREQFLALHSQPILKNLSSFFVHCFGEVERNILDEKSVQVFRNLPETGDLNLEEVLQSVYFFS